MGGSASAEEGREAHQGEETDENSDNKTVAVSWVARSRSLALGHGHTHVQQRDSGVQRGRDRRGIAPWTSQGPRMRCQAVRPSGGGEGRTTSHAPMAMRRRGRPPPVRLSWWSAEAPGGG